MRVTTVILYETDKLIIALKPAASLTGQYSVRVKPGLVQDLAGNGNVAENSGNANVSLVGAGYTIDTVNDTITLSCSKRITRILVGDAGSIQLS